MANGLMVLMVVALALAAGCAGQAEEVKGPAEARAGADAAEYHTMTVHELRDGLAHKDFFLVDVHIPEQEHIEGTDAFIPYDQIDQHLDELPADKGKRIVVYCRSGSMSETASKRLVEIGDTNG